MSEFDYVLNDPVSPIKISMDLPPEPKDLLFSVGGFAPPPSKTPAQLQAINTYITVAGSINNRQESISRSRDRLTKWAATRQLFVNTRAGKEFNAFYDRSGLKFCYYPSGNSIIYFADSSDVVTHELGHALLDAMRPDFWSVQALEIWSFHEAYADITALLSIMDYPAALEAAIKETNGDLRKSNVISRLAEQVGEIVYGKRHLYLRDAVNTFKYQNPQTLPGDAPDEELCAECHSFGRVFLGTWYEIVVGIYEQECKQSDPVTALTTAKNIAADYMYKAIVQSPSCSAYHYAIAQGMLVADQANGGKYASVLNTVFTNRKLIQPQIKILANIKQDDIKLEKKDLVIKQGSTTTVVLKRSKTVKLFDYHKAKTLSALSIPNDIAKAELEVPADIYYQFNEKGVLQHQILPKEFDVVDDARRCVPYLIGQVGRGKMWNINSKNKLVRKFVE